MRGLLKKGDMHYVSTRQRGWKVVSLRDGFLDQGSSAHKTSNSGQTGYMSLREAARWAGVSPKTMQRWFARGLTNYQAGPREKVLVRREDIDRFLLNKRVRNGLGAAV